MNPDFVDLLRAFVAADVRFLVVGAYALALHDGFAPVSSADLPGAHALQDALSFRDLAR